LKKALSAKIPDIDENDKPEKEEDVPGVPISMYTLKFNSPILPYAKFPLT